MRFIVLLLSSWKQSSSSGAIFLGITLKSLADVYQKGGAERIQPPTQPTDTKYESPYLSFNAGCDSGVMRHPTPHDVKRKIDAKIFELQSSLLEQTVTDNLLHECTVWFRPSHLRDIIIERSEAERICGWPACRNHIPAWGRTAQVVFDLPGGEEAGRFCGKSCAAKSKVLLASIASTSPYSRDSVLRLACPELFEVQGGAKTSVKSEKGAANAQKKVYKRARRRDKNPVVPSGTAKQGDRPQTSVEVPSTLGGVERLVSSTSEEEARVKLRGAVITEEKGPLSSQEATLEAGSDVSSPPEQLHDVRRPDEQGRDGNSDVNRGDTPLPELGTENVNSEDRDPLKDPVDNTCEATEEKLLDSEEGESVTTSEKHPSQRAPEANRKTPEGATTTEEDSNGDSSWEDLPLNSVAAKATVSLHASLVATARGEAGINMCETTKVAPGDAAMSDTNEVGMATTTCVRRQGSTTRRKKGVSFAAGTKECPPSTLLNNGDDLASTKMVARRKEVSSSRMKERANRRGRREGPGAGGSKPKKASKDRPPTVLGEVVERPPVLPAQKQIPVVEGTSDKGVGQLVEGYLSRIEADVSFRVFPRGYKGSVEVPDGADDDESAGTSTGKDTSGDASPGNGDVLVEDEDKGGREEDEDDEENDRLIWREDFGEEMPPDVAEGPWIDMEALGDKAMREEFASTIGTFPLLWGALSELVTPTTRTICRAARAAAANTGTTGDMGKENGVSTSELAGDSQWSLFASQGMSDVQARRAGAVAEAIEVVTHRHVRIERAGKDTQDSSEDSVTDASALRHNGVSTMVNMYLAQAEHALGIGEKESESKPSGEGEEGKGDGEGHGSQAWVWSKASETKRGVRSGAWIPEARGTCLNGSATQGGRSPCSGKQKLVAAASGGAQTRRVMAAVVDTFDAAQASGAPDLSITQWKVVCVVLLTAMGLGSCAPKAPIDQRDNQKGPRVDSDEAKSGTEACTRLCGDVSVISEREFQLLVEVLLDE